MTVNQVVHFRCSAGWPDLDRDTPDFSNHKGTSTLDRRRHRYRSTDRGC
jgi:hypothetical protein